MFILRSNPFIEQFFSSYVLKCWSIKPCCIEISDNLKEHRLVSKRHMVRLFIEVSIFNYFCNVWSSIVVQQNLCIFFKLLLDVSGSKYDSKRLIIDNAQQWLFDINSSYTTPFISKYTTKPYFHGCCVLESISMVNLNLSTIFYA